MCRFVTCCYIIYDSYIMPQIYYKSYIMPQNNLWQRHCYMLMEFHVRWTNLSRRSTLVELQVCSIFICFSSSQSMINVMAYIIGILGAPLSSLLHVDGTTVFNGTTGVGGSEQIDVPMNELWRCLPMRKGYCSINL